MSETETEWLSIGGAARRLGVSVDTIRRWDAEGKILTTRTPSGHRRISAAEVERILSGRAA